MRTFQDIISLNDRIMAYLGNRWLDGVLANQGSIEPTLNLFADEESRDLYCREILYCILGNFLKGDLASTCAGLMSNNQFNAYIKKAKDKNICPDLVYPDNNWLADYCRATTFIIGQYQYQDKVRVLEDDVCLDAGACFGDTSIWMLEQGARETWAFEIDRKNIECMRKTFAKKDIYKNIHIVEKALADKAAQVFYTPHPNNSGAGRITPQTTNNPSCYEVDCVTMDDFCEENAIVPTFVKMDIEGAEPIAIAGGRRTLAKHRPRFAICIYHRWEHRWQIPLQLDEILPDYNFYLKKSSPACETVFMGAPKEQLTWIVSGM